MTMTDIVRTVRVANLNGHDEYPNTDMEGLLNIVDANPGMWCFVGGALTTPGTQAFTERWNSAGENEVVTLSRPLVGGLC
ncbi:MAG: hypothetical protein CMJ29_13520 [Phycisphaerae bacterium]|nr:hypothetical protein [Phycisphaerae bacterium]|tara:strand:+ start:319 stop:558 length:240 start_codon:yes stop_codon:yes gene_type:complete